MAKGIRFCNLWAIKARCRLLRSTFPLQVCWVASAPTHVGRAILPPPLAFPLTRENRSAVPARCFDRYYVVIRKVPVGFQYKPGIYTLLTTKVDPQDNRTGADVVQVFKDQLHDHYLGMYREKPLWLALCDGFLF